jgi:hypothetical protein
MVAVHPSACVACCACRWFLKNSPIFKNNVSKHICH